MKVDVEGHELEVFKGAAGMLAHGNIKRIQFEYGGCNIDSRLLLNDLFEFFAPYGYAFYKKKFSHTNYSACRAMTSGWRISSIRIG